MAGNVLAMGDAPLSLAEEFPAATRDQWLALVAKQLKRELGDDPEAVLGKLRSTTYEGITIEPFYDPSLVPAVDTGMPGQAPFTRGRAVQTTADRAWEMRQRISPERGRGAGAYELERGATGLLIDLRDAETIDEALLASLLDGVYLDLAPITLQAADRWEAAAEAFIAAAGATHRAAACLGADPIGEAASRGDVDGLDEALATVATWITRMRAEHPATAVVAIDGTRFHDAGASDADELAYVIATVVDTARALDKPLQLFASMEVRVAATADQFATIAKIRAVRQLLSRVAEVLGDKEASGATRIHAMESTAMLTVYDPWVNMLRGTMACFAAGVAGADAITVLPYDHLLSAASSEIGLRLARNTQSVLAFESNLTKVIDPAGGSHFVETLTAQIADGAWARFQDVERNGGMRAAIADGSLLATVEATATARQRNVATRRDPLTGVSEFPNIDEPARPGLVKIAIAGQGLPTHRFAEGFEALRSRVDAHAESNGRPAIFLAAIGEPAANTARVMFAKNLFEIAGVRAIIGNGGIDATAIASELTASGTTLACLCSSDELYAAHAAPVAAALAKAGATATYLAGRPKDLPLDLPQIYAGSDVQATLTELLDRIGVA